MKDTLSQAHVAALRWTLLRTLMVGGHLGATDRMCLDVTRAEYIGVTEHRVRTELDYLEPPAGVPDVAQLGLQGDAPWWVGFGCVIGGAT